MRPDVRAAWLFVVGLRLDSPATPGRAAASRPGHLSQGAPSLNDPKAAPAPQNAAGDDDSPGVLAYLIAAGLSVAVGFVGSAAITAYVDEAMTPWPAFIVGGAVPFMLERITLSVPFLVGVTREGFRQCRRRQRLRAKSSRPPTPAARRAGERVADGLALPTSPCRVHPPGSTDEPHPRCLRHVHLVRDRPQLETFSTAGEDQAHRQVEPLVPPPFLPVVAVPPEG